MRLKVVFFLLFTLAGHQAFAADEAAGPLGPVYVNLDPAFVISYGSDSRSRYLQCEIALLVRDNMGSLEVDHHGDYIRHVVVMELSKLTVAEVRSPYATTEIANKLLRAIQEVMLEETSQVIVDQVVFNSFLVSN